MFNQKAVVTSSDGTEANAYTLCSKIVRDEASGFSSETRTYLVPGNLAFAPQVGDTFTYQDVDYYIHAVAEVSPTGKCLLYKLTVIA